MHHNQPEEFLAIDVGSARVGIARGSSAARIAQPLKTVEAKEAIDELRKLLADNKVAAIVAGLPRSLEGNETEQTRYVRDWVKSAKDQIKLPFYWQDEALTTKLTEDQGQPSDATAAAMILQDFLDSAEDDRVVA
ncbi:MAG: Holliday junction resolvase RuvX [Candidatus Saccharimonadales bacterium]